MKCILRIPEGGVTIKNTIRCHKCNSTKTTVTKEEHTRLLITQTYKCLNCGFNASDIRLVPNFWDIAGEENI